MHLNDFVLYVFLLDVLLCLPCVRLHWIILPSSNTKMQINLSIEMGVGCAHKPHQRWGIQPRIIKPQGTKRSVVGYKSERWDI